MKTPLHALKAKIEKRILDAKEMSTPHWIGVVAGLQEALDDINKIIEEKSLHDELKMLITIQEYYLGRGHNDEIVNQRILELQKILKCH